MNDINELYTRLAEISNALEQRGDADTDPMVRKAREGALIAGDALLTIAQRQTCPDHEEIDSFSGAWRSVWSEMTW